MAGVDDDAVVVRYLNSGTYMGDRDALLHLLNFYADQWEFKCYNAVVRQHLQPQIQVHVFWRISAYHMQMLDLVAVTYRTFADRGKHTQQRGINAA